MTTARRAALAAALTFALAGCSDTPPAPAAAPSAPTTPAPATTSPPPDVEACRLVRALTEDTELEPADLGNIGWFASRADDPVLAAAGVALADAVAVVTTTDDPRGEPMIALTEARIAVSRACDRIR